MIFTGVFATEDEKNECFAEAKKASETPVIAFSSQHALKEGGLSGQAWKATKELCHKYALAHGLPEIEGYYGMSGTGEFVSV